MKIGSYQAILTGNTSILDKVENKIISLRRRYDWIEISPAMPFIANNELNFSITITAGN